MIIVKSLMAAWALVITAICAEAKNPVRDVVDWASFLSRHDLVWKRMPTAWHDAPFMGNGRLALSMSLGAANQCRALRG